MADPGEPPAPQTLKLFRKKYSPLVLVLGVIGVVLAVLFMVYMIVSAMQPPEIHYEYVEPPKKR